METATSTSLFLSPTCRPCQNQMRKGEVDWRATSGASGRGRTMRDGERRWCAHIITTLPLVPTSSLVFHMVSFEVSSNFVEYSTHEH